MQTHTIVSILTGLILFFLSSLHIYWAFGGRIGYLSVLPETGGKAAFQPGPFLTLGVAAVLFGFGTIALWNGGIVFTATKESSWLAFGVSCIFFGRAIGDFRLVGFFKRIRGTGFAKQDDRIYSPLCVLLGSSYAYLGIINFYS